MSASKRKVVSQISIATRGLLHGTLCWP